MNCLLWNRSQIQTTERQVTPHNSSAAIAPVRMPRLSGQYCSIRDPLLDKTTHAFSHPAVYRALSSTLKSGQHAEFPINSRLISL